MVDVTRRSVTIRDVARLAGVSHTTVSRVLNNQPNTSPTVRTRVEEAMRQLDFRPSTIARALATNRSSTIGVICTDNGTFGPPKTLRAIEVAARDAGYYISIVNLATIDRGSMSAALNHLTDQSVEGLVIIAPQSAMLDALARVETRVPYVTVESRGIEGEHALAINQREGARLATQHLIELGHEVILHISGPLDWLDSQGRIAGWRATMASAGLKFGEPIVGDWSLRSGYVAGIGLASRRDFTAIFASNDHMALGLIRGFKERGIRVPDDVSIVGFDDVPEAAFVSPALTTVKPDYTALGTRCIEVLLGGRASESERVRLIEPALSIRESAVARR